jgi:hypothetical protein
MNRAQTRILISACAAALILLLWPPWNAVCENFQESRTVGDIKLERYYKRHPYWLSGELDPYELGARFPEFYGRVVASPRIAFGRVAFEMSILSVATMLAMLIARTQSTNQGAQKEKLEQPHP